jgi:hypothetical protein
MSRARENPVPVFLWLAVAAGAALVGTVVYVAAKNGSPNNAGPAIAPGQVPTDATVAPAADAAFVAAQRASDEKAAQAVATAATTAALLNTTYVLEVNGNKNIALKVGDTIRMIPSMVGPPMGTWQWNPPDPNVLTLLGTTNGIDIFFKAAGTGSTIVNVQNAAAGASFDVTITVS